MTNTVVILISMALLCISAAQGRKPFQPNNEGPMLHISGICQTMAKKHGYICEEHMVTTEDGYILSLQRLPAGRSGKKAHRPPVLIQHGLFCDATIWLVNTPSESLGFVLADNGYDVWLANSRGTKYSGGHISLHPNDMAYWDWSWDELASYDLPAFVKYVHSHTGKQLHYAGHSLGTLTPLVAFSQGQVFDMLRSAALLSPIAHMHHVSSPLARLAADTFITNHLYWLGLREFLPNGEDAIKFVEGICNNILNINCSDLLPLFTGPNSFINSTSLEVFLDHGLQSTATMNLIHLCQMIKGGFIAKYDYGNLVQNMEHYGQPIPPLYDMREIPNDFPLFLSYGGQDLLSDVKDVDLLLNDLQEHDSNKLVVLFKEDYAHLDFVMGVNVKQMIYDPMIHFFKMN